MATVLLAYRETMDTTRYKQKLLDKQRELQDEIAHLGEEARNVDPAEVRDYTERAEIDGQTAGALDSATTLTHMLENVRDALNRIEEGGYGTCIVCGQPIEPQRLDAVPWTLYCLKDQEQLDREKGVPQGSTL
jgi:RNA polymerase-binding transcription factor